MRSERWSEKPDDVGSIPSPSTRCEYRLVGMAPAFQAGIRSVRDRLLAPIKEARKYHSVYEQIKIGLWGQW